MKNLSKSIEDYIETIYMIEQEKGDKKTFIRYGNNKRN